MTLGPERARLRQYLSGAKHEATDAAGENWRTCGILLQDTARAIRDGAKKVRDGDGTDDGLSGVTAQAVLDAFHASATSMQDKGTRLVAAGEVLNDAARVMRNAQTAEAGMTDLQQPAAYSPPSYSPGYTPTPQEIQAEGDKRQAANQQMAAYSSARAQQEAAATEWTQKLDAVFLESIPTMQAIHGQPDPTEPPSAPSSPTSPSVPLTPSTPGVPSDPDRPDPTKPDDPDQDKDPDRDKDQDKDQDLGPPRPPVIVDPLDPTHPTTHPTTVATSSTETTTVSGNQQSGVTYQGPQMSTPGSSGGAGGAGGMNAAAFGAAGAAGGASGLMGGVRAGSASASAGSAPTRPIGATGRSGSAGALSRPAASSGSTAARGGTAGSPASRGAASGSTAGRGGAGSAGARGAGSAGGRGAASGSTAGSRSGGRGSGGTGAAAGRGGRKGDRDEAQKRDGLVYDRDWLGDDDVAPGVLD